MSVTKEQLALAIQNALPQARVFWEKEPNTFFTEQPCILTAISITNPEKKLRLDMPKGIGQEPLDDVVKTFVDYFNYKP